MNLCRVIGASVSPTKMHQNNSVGNALLSSVKKIAMISLFVLPIVALNNLYAITAFDDLCPKGHQYFCFDSCGDDFRMESLICFDPAVLARLLKHFAC